MSITGAILGAGIAITTLGTLAAIGAFASLIAYTAVTQPTRPHMIALGICATTIILGAAMIGATA